MRQLIALGALTAGLSLGLAAAACVADPVAPASAQDQQAGTEGEHGGLRLVLDRTRFPVNRRKQLSFRILDRDGKVVRDFEVAHERRMHLIVVSHDLSAYQHIHPRLGTDGRWRIPLRLRERGPYRVFADFKTAGTNHALGGDISVPGDHRPRRLSAPSNAGTVDGYRVSLSRDRDELRFTVRRDGRVVKNLQPYLGARGHLVVLRQRDLAYLHVHPEDEATPGRAVRFTVHYPSRGRYRLFLQFRHRDRVRTVAFTQLVEAVPDETSGGQPDGGAGQPGGGTEPPPGGGGDDHNGHGDHP